VNARPWAALPCAFALTGAAHGIDVLPTLYESGRFYATPRARNGEQLRLLIDTGGGGMQGMYWFAQSTAERIGLRTAKAGTRCGLVSGDLLAPLPSYQPQTGLVECSSRICAGIRLRQREAYRLALSATHPAFGWDFPGSPFRWTASRLSCCWIPARPPSLRRQAFNSSTPRPLTARVSQVISPMTCSIGGTRGILSGLSSRTAMCYLHPGSSHGSSRSRRGWLGD